MLSSVPEPSARVAVIVPCFNDGHVVGQAVDSIDEPEPIEIVVVDDASTDPFTLATLDRLRACGVRVARHERNRGLSAARMTGLDSTTAPYVFPLDADDLAVPGTLSQLADGLDTRPDVAVYFGDYAEFGTHSRVRHAPERLDGYRIAYRNDYPVSSLFRRTALTEVGGWRDVAGEVGYEDWHLWMTLVEGGHAGRHIGRGTVVLRRRLHGQRMLSDAGRRHRQLYAHLRRLHPRLFSEIGIHRRHSDIPAPLRALYPLLFGARPPLGLADRARRITRRLTRSAATEPPGRGAADPGAR